MRSKLNYTLTKLIRFLQYSFAMFLLVVAFIVFTIGPILASVYFQNPVYLLTYFISWLPAFFLFEVAQALSEV